MERANEQHDETVIDLGAVSAETKGTVGGQGDFAGLLQIEGLSDD